MRLPTPLAIFAVAAVVGAAMVVGPRMFREGAATASAGRPGTLPPATPTGGTVTPTAPSGAPGDPLPNAAKLFLRNKATTECLDSNSAGEVYMLGCNGGEFQRWTVKDTNGGTRNFRNVATGRCLESREREGSRPVFTVPCDGNVFQKWYFITDDENRVSLQNDESRLCLWNTPRPATAIACEKARDDVWWVAAR